MSPSSTTSSEGGGQASPGVSTSPGGLGSIPVRSAQKWFVVVLFLLVCAGTGFVDSLAPVPLPVLVGAEGAKETQLSRDATIADGTRARLIERHLRLRSRVRRYVTPEYGFALYRWLHEVRPTVIYGKDGWLFIRSRAAPRRTIDDAALSLITSQMALISHRMTDLGSRLIMVPIPRKAVLCADRLPSWCRSQSHVDTAFVAGLLSRGVTCVDLFATLQASPAAPYYYMRGSHWTDESRLAAAQEICRVTGILSPEDGRRTRIIPLGLRREEYDVLEFAGVEPNRRIGGFLAHTKSPRYHVRGKVAGAEESGARILLFGTSFSRDLLYLLLQHFSQRPIERHAERGDIPLDVLARYVQECGPRPGPGELPGVVIIELPMHAVFDGLDNGIASLLGLLQPPWVTPLPVADVSEVVGDASDGVHLRHKATPILIVHRGRLAHLASGSLGIRVEGTLTGGDALVDIDTGSGRTTVRWLAGQDSLVLPLVGECPSVGARVFLRARRGSGKVHAAIRRAEVVAYGALRMETPAGIDPMVQGGGWSQAIHVDALPSEGAHSLLEIRLDVRGAFDGRASVEFPEKGGTAVIVYQHLLRDAVLVLDLPCLSSPPPWTVRVFGSGQAPRNVVGSARLLCLGSPLS